MTPTPTWWQRSRPLALPIGLTSAAVAVLAVRDPHREGSYGVCPLLALTGLFCPFCGGLRAVHDLTTGDLTAALSDNVMVVLALPFVVLAVVVARLRRRQGRKPVSPPSWAAFVSVAVIVAFGVVRNLPFGSGLAP